MPPSYFPLRWESTGDQWWYASPIDWAAANGHYDLVRELIYLDTNLLIKLTSLRRIRRLETVWDDEEQFNDVAKCRSQVAQNLLMECESKGTHKTHNSLIRAGYGGWLLYTACSAGDVDFVKKLLEIDPNLVFGEGEYGVTDIFYAAARSKNSEVFRLLLDFSVSEGKLGGNCSDLDGKSKENFSVFRWEMRNRAVHAAARGGNLEILREIIGDSSDILVYRDAQGSTLLHSASGRGQIEVVKYLLASYDVIKSSDNQGNTALHVAAYRGHLAVVKVLISSSHSIASLTNNYGDTFLHMAVAGFQTLGFRLVDRQIELIKELVLGKSVNIEDMINVKNKGGRTTLHMAVNENIKSEVVELLMRIFGINLNIRDNDGMTPLDLLKRRPRSASSEILIKRLISAGGISNCHDHVTRSAIVSHLKMAGIGGSPGISFRIPDAEIFLYAGIENEIVPHACDIASTDYSPSSELGRFNSPDMSNSFGIKKSNSMRRLKMLFLWPRKERKYESCKIGDDDSINSYRVCKDFEGSPISLRERFSQQPSLPNNKRILSMRNRNSLPSSSTKKKFSARLMHGVLQAVPHLDFQSPSSPLSESSRSSPISIDKQQGRVMVKEIEASPISNLSFDGESSQKNRKNSPFDKKLMNRYLCFGAQGLAVEDPIRCKQPHQIYKHSSSLMT